MNYLKEKKVEAILLLTVFFGFVLRVINANNRTVYGDPPHFVLNAINFLNSGLLVTWDQSTFLWYATTNIFYNIFGISQFSSRFSAVLFGTLTIIAIYLFVKEFSGNNKIALISSIIYAFAPTFIFNAADEHDISVIFFIVCVFYCLIKGLKTNSKIYILLSGVLFGLACMWKAYTPLTFLAYVGMIYYYHHKGKFNIKKNWKLLAGILAIILIMVTPVLVYNYSNYHHNQVPTFFFIKFFKGLDNSKINELYGWVAGGELNKPGFSLERIFIDSTPEENVTNNSELYLGLTYSLWYNGPILCILAVIGLIFMFLKRKKDEFAKEYLIFFLLYLIIPFFVLIDTNYLTKHFIQFIAFSIPVTAYLLYSLYENFNSKYRFDSFVKKNLYILFALLVIFEFVVLMAMPFFGETFYSKNPEAQIMDYKAANIPEQSLIIYDDRVFNQIAGWMFNDRYYIPLSNLQQFMNFNQQSTNRVNVPVYVVECAIDSCGWAVNSELNQSEEAFFSHINTSEMPLVFTAYDKPENVYYFPIISKPKLKEKFKVYRFDMEVDLSIAEQIKEQYSYFMYPLEYKNKRDTTFRNFIYNPDSLFERALNKFAWLIFYLEIVLSFVTIGFILFEYYNQRKSDNRVKEIIQDEIKEP
ncbi:MAG: glycosyltransferase family 39 protein [Candidatus Pacearchaeota archaeon]|jgi:4-amino-4-deoxy-L-arabinose transferase-like glycosyltransferase